MTDRPTTCHARLGPDGQMRCPRCSFVWDTDDADPPACLDKPASKPKVKKPSKRKPRK